MAFSLRKTSDRGSVGLDIDGRYLAAAQVDAAAASRAARARTCPRASSATARSSDPRGARPAPQELRRRRRAAAQRAARRGEPADRRPRGRAAAHRGRRSSATPRSASRRPRRSRCRSTRPCSTTRSPAYTDRRPTARPRMQVVLVAARRKMIEPLLEAVKAAGLKADGIDLDAFALVRALAAADGDEPGRDRARLLPPRRRHQPRRRGRLQLLLHPAALGGLGRGRRRLAARRRDPAVDRLLHDPAAGASPSARSCSRAPARSTASSSRASRPTWASPSRSPAPLGTLDGSALGRDRGPAPLHRGGRARAGSGGVKPVNLIPQDQRRRAADRVGGGKRRARSRSACSPRCSRWSSCYVLTREHRHRSQGQGARPPARRPTSSRRRPARRTSYTDFAQIAQTRTQSVAQRRRHALRLGALHARAVARHARGQLAAVRRRLRDRRHRHGGRQHAVHARAGRRHGARRGQPDRLHAATRTTPRA